RWHERGLLLALPCRVRAHQSRHSSPPIEPMLQRTNPFDGLPRSHFHAVVADPPLKFKVRSPKGEGLSASRHYRVMRFDEIMALPVADIAAADAWLFLWVPSPFILRIEELMTAWGFEYSGKAFCWVKLKRSGVGYFTGMGYTTHKNTEDRFLGRRGS